MSNWKHRLGIAKGNWFLSMTMYGHDLEKEQWFLSVPCRGCAVTKYGQKEEKVAPLAL